MGQAAALGCAHAACGCAQLCRRCLATQKGTHRPQWGHRVEGCMEASTPAHCLHSPGVPCICACPRTPHVCPCHVSEGHTRVHTRALKCLCLVPSDPPAGASNTLAPPLPVLAWCLAAPLGMTTCETQQALSAPRLGVPAVPTPAVMALCTHRLRAILACPTRVPPHALPMGRSGGCPMAG